MNLDGKNEVAVAEFFGDIPLAMNPQPQATMVNQLRFTLWIDGQEQSVDCSLRVTTPRNLDRFQAPSIPDVSPSVGIDFD